MRTDQEKTYLLKAVDALNREIIVVSPEHMILAANRHALKTHGLDITGKLCHEVYFDCDTECYDCPAPRVLHRREPVLCHIAMNPMDVERVSCYPIFDGEDIEALVMMDFDISRLGRLEDKLRRSNAFLQNMMKSAVDAVIAADRTGKIFFFNQSAAEVTGYSVEEALSNLRIQDLYPEREAWEIMRKMRSEDYGGKGKLKEYHIDLLGKYGERIPISLYASIVYEDEQEVATIGFFHDLRMRIQLKKELEKTQMQLLQSEKMASIGKLAAGVAHQLNNPLGGITLFTKLMLEEYELTENAQQDLMRILRDAERCRDTVKELLEFARQTRYEMRPHDINKAISRTLFLLENQALFQNITIVKNMDAGLPPISGDMQQLNHLFMNIILNAAQAMDGNGQLFIDTRCPAVSERVCIEITDSGPGIPEEILPHIFDPFYTTKEEGKGTGLGLSLAYGIVESHGGAITACNRVFPEQGASFLIELPVYKEDNGSPRGGVRSEE